MIKANRGCPAEAPSPVFPSAPERLVSLVGFRSLPLGVRLQEAHAALPSGALSDKATKRGMLCWCPVIVEIPVAEGGMLWPLPRWVIQGSYLGVMLWCARACYDVVSLTVGPLVVLLSRFKGSGGEMTRK